MRVKLAIVLSLCFCIQGFAVAAAGENTSIEWVCKNHPKRVTELFARLNLDYEGMAAVKAAAEKEDWPAACRA